MIVEFTLLVEEVIGTELRWMHWLVTVYHLLKDKCKEFGINETVKDLF